MIPIMPGKCFKSRMFASDHYRLEAKKQLEYLDEYPDVVFACCGGGSNFAGIAFPFLMDKFKEQK